MHILVRTIDTNSAVTSNVGRINAVKSLVIQSCVETFVQLYCFATNSALRYSLNIINKSSIPLSVFRLFARKKTNEAWTNLFEYVTVGLELAPVRPSVPIVVPRGSSNSGEGSLRDGGIGRNTRHLNSVIPISLSYSAMPTVDIC